MLTQRLIQWAREASGDQISFYFTYKVAPVDRARNQIVDFFRNARVGDDQRTFTHLLMVDSDTIPPVDAVTRLLSHGKDIVTGLTPIVTYTEDGWQTYDNAFVSRDRDKSGKVTTTNIAARHTGLQEVFRCGAACILIRREVFETLAFPPFAFDTENGVKHTRSEDISFCDMAVDAGFKIYADTDVVCQHYKAIMID